MDNYNLDKFFLASIVESSHDSIITINLDLEITSWNKAAEGLYGYPAGEAIGKRLTTLTLPKDFQKLLEKIEKIKESKEVEIFESERVGKDKTHMILEVVVSPVKDGDGELIGISTIARDLTSRRLAEKAKHDKDVLQRLIVAQEDERSRISRDLHDELGQQITSLQLALERAKGSWKDDKAQESFATMSAIVNEIDKSVDFLAWELRPALLDGIGLEAAIQNYLGQWSLQAGVETEMITAGLSKTRLSPALETNIYRIVQECLNNTHKHAEAKRVEIVLDHRDGAIFLVVADNGKGFSLRNKRKLAKGLGLTGMRERAASLGGSVELESAPGRGTSIHVKIPASIKAKRKVIRAIDDTNWG